MRRLSDRHWESHVCPQPQDLKAELEGNNPHEVGGRVGARFKELQDKLNVMAKIINDSQAQTFDNLLEEKNHSFTVSVMEPPLPPKFKVPQMDAYVGNKDPLDHIETYKAHMFFQGATDEIVCWAFTTTLIGHG